MTLREALSYEPVELTFGTSGLRGLVTDMTDLECYINISGFLRYLQKLENLKPGDTIYIAGDLRDSTPRIMEITTKACEDFKLKVVNCAKIPTPALAHYALTKNAPCIMITGSHIPADRNGIKFCKRSGEVLKSDESEIQSSVAEVRRQIYELEVKQSDFNTDGSVKTTTEVGEEEIAATNAYKDRFLQFFNGGFLEGKKIAIYQHSAVGRDILTELLQKFGAEVIVEGRSDVFIPIDTENVTSENKAYFKSIAKENPGLFAIVSTDGDSDRPFIIDENGEFYRGDIVGCIVAKYCGAKFIATPISSNDAVDVYAKDNDLESIHTKIGSPYVIDAMNESTVTPKVGWEVNGGFLTGSEIEKEDKLLTALPTRDAFFPILAVLDEAVRNQKSVSELFAELPKRFTGGGLIDDVDPVEVAKFKQLCSDQSETEKVMQKIFSDTDLGPVKTVNLVDGLRLVFESSEVIHLRPSGNAPQMRVYTNTDTQVRADKLSRDAIEPGGYIESLLSEL